MSKYFSWGRILQAAIAWLIVFALVGKPLSSVASPSTQVGMGSIPYSGIWSNGSQAGTGFGRWELSQPTNGPDVFFYVNSSTETDNSTAPGNASNDINAAGVAWGMSAIDGALAWAIRPFPSAMTSGQVFQIDMDNGFINTGGSVGFALQDTTGTTFSPSSNSVFEFYFNGGTNNYTVNAASVGGSPLPPFTDVGMHLTFTLTSTNTYLFTVLAYTPGGSATQGTTYTYTGTLLNPTDGRAITSVRLFNYQAGSGTNFNAYFNNMNISGGVAGDSASNTTYNTPGTTFRVWAPDASAVTVLGSWLGFSTNAVPLYAEGNGNWSADVTGALNQDQYLYGIFNSSAGTNVFKQDPRSRKVTSSTGNSVIYNTASFNWQGDNFTAPGISNAVIYEMCIGSFNDPYAPDGPGTFYTATNTLPYLKQLGVTAVEVMPINEFPGSFSWGYNPVDLFAADNYAYGGPDGFKTFVRTAHKLGIAVIVDTCQNHYGGTDAPDYGNLSSGLWDFDGTTAIIGGTNIPGGGIYFYESSVCLAFAQTWGPRPNYSTPQVEQFIADNFTMWMSECHVDGFRWDSVGEIVGDYPCSDNGNFAAGSNLVTSISGMIHSFGGGKINIGEDNPYSWTGANGFDASWDNNTFLDNIEPQLTAASDSNRNMASISYAVNLNFDGGGMGSWGNVVFMEDHDQCGGAFVGANRMPVDIDSSDPTGYYARKRTMLGSAITLTTCGIPMLLQGEEFLTTADFGANIALDWSSTNTYAGIVSYYTDLISLRRNLTGRSSGLQGLNTQTIWEDDSSKIIAYHRWNTGHTGDDVVVVCNFGNTYWPYYTINNTQLGFPQTNIWYTQFNSDWTKYCSDYSNYGSSSTTVSTFSAGATISIAPYSVLVFSQNIPAAPPVPQNLSVTSVFTNQVTIGWTVSSGATGYIINRGTNEIATTSTNSYTDTGLAEDLTYCYTVAATNIGGVSGYSLPACATTLPATADTNLLAYWTFDEDAGTLAYDYSGNMNTGAVYLDSSNGGTWTTSGIISNALFFDNFLTEVTVPNSAFLNPVNGITLAAWVYAGQNGNGFWAGNILEKGASDNQYALLIDGNTGSLDFFVAGVTNIEVSTPSVNAWHHVAGTYDGKSAISLYIDGQLVAQQSASGALPVTTDSLAIGNESGGDNPNYDFYGTIDDVRIYGSALPAEQIYQLYNTDSVGDGVPNWWRLLWFGSSSSTNASACTACCAACDADGTGQNNFFKYVAGLNPTDPTQIFVVQIAPSNQVMNVTFGPINSTDTYTVQSSPDLVNYSALTNYNPQVTGINQLTITDLDPWPSNEFYRVQISLPSP